jgi:beta-glucosidase
LAAEEMKFRDPDLPIAERADDLVSRMTLEEKAAQMCHAAPAIPRLGVPEYNWWNECLHGTARAGQATVFPQAIGMAASFNAELMFQVATAISDEARAKHHQALRQGNRSQYFGLTFWTPNINIFRDPRWGRGQETYGEDPYLTARMGVAFVRGLQGDDPGYLKLVATPKHYAVHSGREADRHHFDAVVSQRDLRETYLPAFEACVREGGAWSVMGAYNRTNGEPCCASPTLLQKILRGEWGFPGYVVSDCGAIRDLHETHKVRSTPEESAALAVKSGCDLNCGEVFGWLVGAVRQGLIDEAEVDVALKRLIVARLKLGMFDPEDRIPWSSIPPEIVGGEEHVSLARRMAQESIVLLKNEGGLLPLGRDLRSAAVVGPNAASLDVLLGNYNGYPKSFVTPLEGILSRVSAGTQVHYSMGCGLLDEAGASMDQALWVCRDADVIIAFMGLTAQVEGEEGAAAFSDAGGDRVDIGLPAVQQRFLERLQETGKPVVLVLMSGSALAVPWAQENVPAILQAWYPGQQGGHAVADALFGDCNPAGRLPVTVPRSVEQLPPFEEYAMQGRTYRFIAEEPLYRFGYGLSYTRFAYADLRVSPDPAAADDSVSVSVDVTNVGDRDGDEAVQLYVSDVQASAPVPLLHLEGFRRVHLKAGETKRLTFELQARQLAAYDDRGRPFVEPGEFVISVGGGQPADPSSGAVSAGLVIHE